ncbi:MAG: hypothetical protein ACM3YE_13060, partial [Bacteroidota bacterium]
GDRDHNNRIELVDALKFIKAGSRDSFVTLNLFKTLPYAGYYYYIPFLITKSADPKREIIFEKNGFYFYDAVPTFEYVSLLEQLVETQTSLSTAHGSFQFGTYRRLNEPRLRLSGGTSNSLLFVTRNYLIKNFRRIYPGVNPELRISSALTKLGSNQIPEVYGFFKYQAQDEYTLGILMEMVVNSGTGWERWGLILKKPSSEMEELLYKEAGQLGNALGYLHRDLAFIAREDGGYSKLNWSDLESRIDQLTTDIKEGLTGLLEFDLILAKLEDIKAGLSKGNLGAKFRIHGDLHLEQVIKTEEGWTILDFEGEPLKSIPERENCDSPLKDLASMLRSISYRIKSGEPNRNQLKTEGKIATGLIDGYLESCREANADFLPDGPHFSRLLSLFQIERAVYECFYESKYRPDWLWIPRTGLEKLIHNDLKGRSDFESNFIYQ